MEQTSYIAARSPAPVGLRLLEERDLPRTLAWRNQDHIRRWFFSGERLTAEQHARWFARYRQRDDDFVFIIEEIQGSRQTPSAVRQKPPASEKNLRPGPQGERHTTRKRVPGACYYVRPVGQAAIYNIDWLRGTAEFGRLMIGEADAAGRST